MKNRVLALKLSKQQDEYYDASSAGAAQMSVSGAVEQWLYSTMTNEEMDNIYDADLTGEIIKFITAEEEGAKLSDEVNNYISKESIKNINSIKNKFNELQKKSLSETELIDEIDR